MKKGLIIGLAATAVAAAVSSLVSVGVSAGPLKRAADPGAADAAPGTLSAARIAARVRAMGLDPRDTPRLRGRYYVLHATDPDGAELRVLADAQFGEILSVLPARRAPDDRPSYGGGARIIHVPQPDDVVADVDAGDDPVSAGEASPVDDVADPEPPRPAVRQIHPPARQRSEAPRVKRHVVTSAPPPPPQAGGKDDKAKDMAKKDTALTPVYPTPDFGPKADAAKFDRLPPPPATSETAPQRLE